MVRLQRLLYQVMQLLLLKLSKVVLHILMVKHYSLIHKLQQMVVLVVLLTQVLRLQLQVFPPHLVIIYKLLELQLVLIHTIVLQVLVELNKSQSQRLQMKPY